MKQRNVDVKRYDSDYCEDYIFGKQYRRNFGTRKDRSKTDRVK